jgi:hypothetical protein
MPITRHMVPTQHHHLHINFGQPNEACAGDFMELPTAQRTRNMVNAEDPNFKAEIVTLNYCIDQCPKGTTTGPWTRNPITNAHSPKS